MDHFDTIVIGAGVSGLTAARLLARAGQSRRRARGPRPRGRPHLDRPPLRARHRPRRIVDPRHHRLPRRRGGRGLRHAHRRVHRRRLPARQSPDRLLRSRRTNDSRMPPPRASSTTSTRSTPRSWAWSRHRIRMPRTATSPMRRSPPGMGRRARAARARVPGAPVGGAVRRVDRGSRRARSRRRHRSTATRWCSPTATTASPRTSRKGSTSGSTHVVSRVRWSAEGVPSRPTTAPSRPTTPS